eukprot:3062990-Rhodomonas_salina.4
MKVDTSTRVHVVRCGDAQYRKQRKGDSGKLDPSFREPKPPEDAGVMDEISRRNSAAELVGTRLVGRELGEGLDLDGIDARGVAASHAPAGLAAISSRQGLWIAEMDKDDGPFLSKAKCQDKNVKLLDLGSVSWSPPSGRPGCLAAVNKRCVLLWDAEKSEVCGNFESGGGQRSLTDLHWEHVLVTGGMDGSVSIHDPRQLTKVAATFQAKAFGHMQVRCSRLNPSLIAGANAGTVLVWDIRAGNRPLHSIMAHVSNKIGTVDWHPRKAEELMTCSPTEPDVKVGCPPTLATSCTARLHALFRRSFEFAFDSLT